MQKEEISMSTHARRGKINEYTSTCIRLNINEYMYKKMKDKWVQVHDVDLNMRRSNSEQVTSKIQISSCHLFQADNCSITPCLITCAPLRFSHCPLCDYWSYKLQFLKPQFSPPELGWPNNCTKCTVHQFNRHKPLASSHPSIIIS